MLRLDYVKNNETFWVLSKIRKSSKIVFSEEVLRRANNSSFLRIDQTDNSGKRILLVFAGEDSAYLFRSRTSFFLDGTFKCCPKQFAKLYSLHIDLGSTSHENYILRFSLHFYRTKKKQHIIIC
jgi:hypothetical protein